MRRRRNRKLPAAAVKDRPRSWGFARAILVIAVAVAISLGVGWLTLGHLDQQDAFFYETGKELNGFLKSYCNGLLSTHETGDSSPVLALYAEAYEAPGRGRWKYVADGEEGGTQLFALRAVKETAVKETSGGIETIRQEVGEYLQGLEAVESAWCKIDLVEELVDENRARMTMKFVLDGTDLTGRRIQDRNFYRWHLARTGDPGLGYGWRIVRDELVDGIRVAGRGDAFESLNPARLGVDFIHRRNPDFHPLGSGPMGRPSFGVIQHSAGGIAAVDYDQDSLPDLFFGDGVEARLYRNLGADENGEPRFLDVTEAAGLAGLSSVHSALFADYDGDGDRDLFVGRHLEPNRLFENVGGGVFADRSAPSGLDVAIPTTGATLLDFDRDGDLDLYLGVYGHAFEAIPRLPFYATNGEANRLFENLGNLQFSDVTQQAGVGDTGWSLAVAAADYDGDGWVDLSVANDFGKKSLYRNQGDGTFIDRAKEAGVLDFSGGMGLTWGDFDDDGDLDLYTSNIKSNQRWYGEDMTVSQYLRNVTRSQWIVRDAAEYWDLYGLLEGNWSGLGQQIGEGNSLFENDGEGNFTERHESKTHQAGWGWSVAFFDYDNDTDLDVYAANGWISSTPGTDL